MLRNPRSSPNLGGHALTLKGSGQGVAGGAGGGEVVGVEVDRSRVIVHGSLERVVDVSLGGSVAGSSSVSQQVGQVVLGQLLQV